MQIAKLLKKHVSSDSANLWMALMLAVVLLMAHPASAGKVEIQGHNVLVDGQSYLPFGMVAHCDKSEYSRLKELGINSIHHDLVFLSYDPQAPTEQEAERIAGIREVLDEAHRNGQTVLLQWGLHYLPKWLFERYPDAHMKQYDGSNGQGGWHPYCLDHSGVREEIRGFIERTIAGIKDHPALLTYCLWNEPHLYGHVCYSEFTLAKFRKHLTGKYDTIDALNSAWSTDYSSFDKVEAPAQRHENYWLAIADYREALQKGEQAQQPESWAGLSANPIAWNDWARFRTKNYAEFFRWEADVIRQADPDHVITTKIVPFDRTPRRMYSRAVDTRLWADTFCDAVGFDGYHHLDSSIGVRQIADFMRDMSKGKPAWNDEAGFAWADVRGRPSPAAERSAFWMQFARGVNGKWFFYWSTNEDFWQRYTYTDNTVQPGMYTLQECSQQLQTHRELLSQTQVVQPEVALLLSRATGIHQTGDYAPGLDMSTVIQCMYRKHIPFQYVTEEDVAGDMLNRFRALIVIGTISISDELLAKIERFVIDGGHVLANARFAQCDDYGRKREEYPPKWLRVRADRWHRGPRERVGSLLVERQAVDIHKKPVDVKIDVPTYASRPMRVTKKSRQLGLPMGAVIGPGSFYGDGATPIYGNGQSLRERGSGWGEQTWEELTVLSGGCAVARFEDNSPAIVTTRRTMYIGRDTCWMNPEFADAIAQFMLNAGVKRKAYARDAAGVEVAPLDLVLCETPTKWVLYATNSPQTLHYCQGSAGKLVIMMHSIYEVVVGKRLS